MCLLLPVSSCAEEKTWNAVHAGRPFFLAGLFVPSTKRVTGALASCFETSACLVFRWARLPWTAASSLEACACPISMGEAAFEGGFFTWGVPLPGRGSGRTSRDGSVSPELVLLYSAVQQPRASPPKRVATQERAGTLCLTRFITHLRTANDDHLRLVPARP